MTGSNEIKMSQAAMVEAIEYYMAAQFTGKHKVLSVKRDTNKYGESDEFIVAFEGADA